MAQSEVPVAWIGLGGVLVGAVATALGARYTSLGSVRAATITQFDPLQSELHCFTSPFIEARIQLMPVLGGQTPADRWIGIASTLPRAAPRWCSMASDPLALFEKPVLVRGHAHQVDGQIRSHQARGARTLEPGAHATVRALHQELGDAADQFSRALKRLAKRGLGVVQPHHRGLIPGLACRPLLREGSEPAHRAPEDVRRVVRS
ncbi:hypothetical protein ABR738_27525 [Streptomyces sp. Edi4]|uniref:hypothetical protein n=1 Tax=Streptomyces sp. Edi4 TaxID=3162527 RepID=UPI0033056B68